MCLKSISLTKVKVLTGLVPSGEFISREELIFLSYAAYEPYSLHFLFGLQRLSLLNDSQNVLDTGCVPSIMSGLGQRGKRVLEMITTWLYLSSGRSLFYCLLSIAVQQPGYKRH